MSILDGALRQLKHNDGSEGFVFAYDKEITEREVAALEREVAELERERDQLRALVQFADARINHMVERRAHPRTVTVTDLRGNTRELVNPAKAGA